MGNLEYWDIGIGPLEMGYWAFEIGIFGIPGPPLTPPLYCEEGPSL